jgi:ceramide kinase
LGLEQLQLLDGVVAVGGDGMFSELLTGLLQHWHLPAALQLRLAHIPAGSTDAVACT